MDPYGYPATFLARACGVELSTARRWKRFAHIPERYRRLVELADSCDLGILSPVWAGWRLTRDELVTPEGARYAIGQVRALHLTAELARELERRLARVLKAAPPAQARELILRVRLESELEGATAGVVSVTHLKPLTAG